MNLNCSLVLTSIYYATEQEDKGNTKENYGYLMGHEQMDLQAARF